MPPVRSRQLPNADNGRQEDGQGYEDLKSRSCLKGDPGRSRSSKWAMIKIKKEDLIQTSGCTC